MSQQEFEQFAVAAWPRLKHAAWLLTGHEQDSEDLASSALAKTYAAWRRASSQPYAYARRCLVNAQIDRVRRSRGREIVTDQVPEQSVDAGYDRPDDRDHLAALLSVLTARERRMVVARYYFDLSEAEVAGELGVSVGTVKSTVSRALTKIRVADDAGPSALAFETAITQGARA